MIESQHPVRSVVVTLKPLYIFLLPLLLLCSNWLQAATITVNGTAGAIVSNGICSISEAILNANSDSQLHTDCSSGSGADTISLTTDVTLFSSVHSDDGKTGTPSITSVITINGQGHKLARNNSVQCSINDQSAPGEFRLLHVGLTGNLSINNLTLEAGCTDDLNQFGGAVLNRGQLAITGSTFAGNSGKYGGAIYNTGTLNSISGSTFLGNSATSNGGVIYASDGATITAISRSTFTGNSADNNGGTIYNIGTLNSISSSTFSENSAGGNGGVIYNPIGAYITTISNNSFAGNSADNNGGAIYNIGILETISNSTFSENSAGINGGATVNAGNLYTISNSTFSGNSAGSNGGAIMNNIGSLDTISNSTFSGNSASSNGGAIVNFGTLSAVFNTIFTNNLGADYSGYTSNNSSNNLCDGTCGVPPNPVTGFDTTLRDNGGPTMTHALRAGSNAINAGDNTACPATDQRGELRNDGKCDIGAFEYRTDCAWYVIRTRNGGGPSFCL